jgi:hypothetical protein
VRSRGASERHGRVALVPADESGVTPSTARDARLDMLGGGVSLLRASVPARLAMVAVAASLLWLSVLWALA